MGCPKMPNEKEILEKLLSKKISRRTFLRQSFMGIIGFYGMGFLLGQKGKSRIKKFVEDVIDGKAKKGSGIVKYRRLGKTNLMVSEVGLGGHFRSSPEKRIEVTKNALDLGINFFDSTTVNESEAMGMSLKTLRAREKCIISVGENALGVDIVSADEKRIRENIETHLKALQTDRIDVLRVLDCHFEDYQDKVGMDKKEEMAKIAEILGRLKKQGKIRFTCFTTHRQDDFMPYVYDADIGNLFDAMMIRYNFLDTKPEEKIIPYAKKHDMGIITLKPFLNGALLNKISEKSAKDLGVEARKSSDPIFNSLRDREKGLAYALLKFILSNKDISVAIPAAQSPREVVENATASIFA